MKRTFNLLMAIMALWLLPTLPALAAGTPAGVNITNKASVSFVVDTTTVNQDSNTVTIQVAELVDATLQWQDSGNILTKGGETNRMTTFRLTNTGNGSEGFSLLVDNAIGSDQFDPVLASLYLDSNGNGQYDAGTDQQHNPGINDPVLVADGSITLFVFNNIPGGVNDGEVGKTGLRAAAQTGGGLPGVARPAGTAYAGGGDGGVTAVVGANGAAAAADGNYQISAVDVTVVKSASIAHPVFGTQPVPTAVITYSIVVTATGSGTASLVTVTDTIPANTTYVPGSLRLEGNPLSDTAGNDAGEVVGGVVSVRIGDLVNTAKTVAFQVTID